MIFENDERENFGAIIFCTGYKIDMTILHDDLKKLVFDDEDKGVLNVYAILKICYFKYWF